MGQWRNGAMGQWHNGARAQGYKGRKQRIGNREQGTGNNRIIAQLVKMSLNPDNWTW